MEDAPATLARSRTVLVVDDEPFILRALSYLLTREGYAVETAQNGQEALDLIRQLRPPIVFLDVMMPKMDGFEVCREVRQDRALDGTYIIILSAKGQQADREQGLLSGANEYMTKPFSPQEVAQRVHTLLSDAQQHPTTGRAS